jgi:single-stranded-DNA-specific exonuclease
MEAAVERISLAVRRGEKVAIFGDYDVDGVTATAVLYDALVAAGVSEVKCLLPDRFSEGYGLGERAVREALAWGAKLLITVDCGSRSLGEVAALTEGGCEVIVTDHHECGEEVPKCVAVVNPKRADSVYPFRELAGVGVVFKVVQGLVARGLIPEGQEKWFLDLVVIGTVCDSMSLIDENRILVYYGLKVLAKTRRVGISELMKVAKTKELNGRAIGFQIGPRLNAAGRMESAFLALELLLERGRAAAYAKAEGLNRLNEERKQQQKNAVGEIMERGLSSSAAVGVVAGKWHEGVIGIIAGKLVEEWRRPSIVFTEMEGGILRGSGRSFGEFNLASAIAAVGDLVVRGGGHAQAAGLTIRAEDLGAFTVAINEHYKGLGLVRQERFLRVTEDLAVSDLSGLTREFLGEIRRLEPFGEGNPEPVFRLSGVLVLSARKIGEKHVRFSVRGSGGAMLNVVGFYVPEEWFRVMEGDRVDVWVTLSEDEWRGTKTVEGIISEIVVK